jgi:hypothetical protein
MKLPMIVGCLLLIFVVVTGAAANGGATQSDRYEPIKFLKNGFNFSKITSNVISFNIKIFLAKRLYS